MSSQPFADPPGEGGWWSPARSLPPEAARILASPLATLLVDVDTRAIVAANDAAAALYGYPRDVLEALSLEHLDPDLAGRPGTIGGPVAARLPRRLHRLADGTEQFVDIIAEVAIIDGRTLMRATVRPAPGEAHPERVESLRIHQAMAEVNRTALMTDREDVVWDEACRIVTETAGYRMASIATPGPDGILAIRVAKGAVGDYLHDRRVDLSDPEATPTGRAAALRRTVVVQDLTDPAVHSPNKAAALRNGYASVCLIPLLDADEVFGILAVFAGEAHAFDPAHVALLEQLAGDLGLVHALHKQARAQRESEDRYRRLVERAVDGITIHDADGCFLDANPAACELLGVSREGLFGRRLEDFAPGLPIAWSEATWRTVASGGHVSFEQQVQRADGRILTLDVRARLLPDGLVEAVSRDVTAQREMEAQLAQAAKMEAVGQLAGGIAHDFNNILTAIGGYASLVRAGLPGDSPLHDDVGEILAATTRAQSLTSQLLAFGRRSMLEPQLVDVRAVVEALEPMLRRLIGEDVTLETMLDDHPVAVSVDPGRLEHALVNLAVNARNAMPDGGRLRIGVRLACNGVPDGPADGDWAVISVADTGQGMPSEVLSRIFEPFYTTRGRGEGTGLGLAMVDGFMRQSGGEVRVASSPGRGTTFWLWLPAAEGQPTATIAGAPTSAEAPASAPKTVLVVEDEPVLRRLAERALVRAGHRVLVAGEGEEALRVAESHAEPIDLLFSDVVMPGMRGPVLASQLRRHRPNLRVLLTSGYTDDGLDRRDGEIHPFLAKPYTPDQLRIKVAEVLDRA